jgi:putative RNA 2'-phosphotransferase
VNRVSKYLALILRHRPEAGKLRLDAQGWADVEAVVDAVRARFGAFDREQLQELVLFNDKKRYAFDDSGTRIRASQGHSVPVELGLEPIEPPCLLYHGTSERALPSILDQGLLKGRRHHVHLSPDVETARKVGSRSGGRPAILEVRSGEMRGHHFFRSANGVWLTDHVPPLYLRRLDRTAERS